MSLSDYIPERAEIKLPKGAFSVRGLSLVDVSVLLRDHMGHLDAMFKQYAEKTKEVFTTAAAQKLVLTLVKDFPDLCAAVITLAADEPGTEAKARALTAPKQIETVTAIGRLTFEEVGGPKKFFASLQPLMAGLGVQAAPTRVVAKKV